METMDPAHQHVEPPRTSGTDLSRAWISVALIPVCFFLAFAVGEGLVSLLGYPVGGDSPVWVSVVSDLAASVVFLIPCVAAVLFGRRAKKAGVRGALVPLVIGAALGLAGLALTIGSEIGNVT